MFDLGSIEVNQRSNLMSDLLSSVWFEIKGKSQKVIIFAIYCKFPMTITQQNERLKLFHSKIERASQEGLILRIGYMNIDLETWENLSHSPQNLAEKY